MHPAQQKPDEWQPWNFVLDVEDVEGLTLPEYYDARYATTLAIENMMAGITREAIDE